MNCSWSKKSEKKEEKKYLHEKIKQERMEMMKANEMKLRESEDGGNLKFVYWKVEGCLIILSLILNRHKVDKK